MKIWFTGLLLVHRLARPTPRSVLLCLLTLSFFAVSSPFATATDPSIHGLRLGMSLDEARALFQKGGIELADRGDNEFSASATPEPVESVKEVRLAFRDALLRKIVISFQTPYEPTAESSVKLFEAEKQRLIGIFQAPGQDVVAMDPPTPQDRYEWIKRGRGYYRTTWELKGRWKAALWLFGEDAGIALIEVCEATDRAPQR